MFLPAFGNSVLDARHDGAVFEIDASQLALTTDSYVVRPIFFPGGDIGSLAVYGTINDLAMCGAHPLYLSVGFVLEEGLLMETLWRVVRSMQNAAEKTGVKIVTGDTKVVDRGKGDQVFINTSGVGVIEGKRATVPANVRAGDVVLLNGDIGRHGMAVMAAREGLEFEPTIESDCAPLADIVMTLLDAGLDIHCLRDLTRGGLSAAANEIADSAGVHIELNEETILVSEPVRAACEILGLDPVHVANEGRFVAFVSKEEAPRALELMRAHPLGSFAQIIGTVTGERPGRVTMRTTVGTRRIVDVPSGDPLPRIC
jgi:hydrogenase expression/formation protein HypE